MILAGGDEPVNGEHAEDGEEGSEGEDGEETAAMLALVATADRLADVRRRDVVELVETWGSARALLENGRTRVPRLRFDGGLAGKVVAATTPEHVVEWMRRLRHLSCRQPRVSATTITSPTFPPGLRRLRSTPFLFLCGKLLPRDERAVAVAGTRRPSPRGIEQAHALVGALVTAGVTVVSGLAVGIDTAAHRGTLAAGGRTVAVLGHGVLAPIYPPSNGVLAREITDSAGAVVSQFWPQTPASRSTFPRRNATSSALALGTVVVEGGERSGARIQAELCLRQGRALFLPEQLVLTERWAHRYAGRQGVYVFCDEAEVVHHLASHPVAPRATQLRFAEEPP